MLDFGRFNPPYQPSLVKEAIQPLSLDGAMFITAPVEAEQQHLNLRRCIRGAAKLSPHLRLSHRAGCGELMQFFCTISCRGRVVKAMD